MPTKVLYDTDIGSDIDDAIALAYLLSQSQCELLGITTVSGEPVQRASLASALCVTAGKDIPIYPGVAMPLFGPQRQPMAPQASQLDRWAHQKSFPTGEALAFQRQIIRAHPGEVVLLATGPMTNVALLFAADPEIPQLLKGFVCMLGDFRAGTKHGEWNAWCDPHAAQLVYASTATSHRSIGFDITSRLKLGRDQVQERFTAPILRPVLDFASVWFAQSVDVTFHDPCAAVTIFEDDVCQFERGFVAMDACHDHEIGRTVFNQNEVGPHQVARSVDAQKFFDSFFSTLARLCTIL